MKESMRHQQAFEYYYVLGNGRSYSKVASHLGISTVSVSKWAKEFGWDSRVKDRDDKTMEKIREQNDLDIVKQMNAYRKVIQASVADYMKRLKDGKVQVESVKDFATLVKLDLNLCGAIDMFTQQQGGGDDYHTVNINITGGDNK